MVHKCGSSIFRRCLLSESCNTDSVDANDEFEHELLCDFCLHIFLKINVLGERSFDDLFKRKTESSDRELDRLRSCLDGLIRSYV